MNATIELAGPEALPLEELARRVLAADGDGRTVTSDREAHYFGAKLDDRSLTPDNGARLGPTRFEDWLAARIA